MTYDSKAELTAASVIAALGGRRCTSFTPHLSGYYHDANGEALEAKPDFVIERPHGPIFLDLKAGALNSHYSRDSSRAALAAEYIRLRHRCPDGMSHSELSTALYNAGRSGYLATLDHAFNHSLWKLRAQQSQLGWRQFLVCFEKNPKPADAKRYCDAGLVWCTLKSLPQLLIRIELEAAGIPISFVHKAQKFVFEVEFDNGTATQLEMRQHFLSAVASNHRAVAEIHAQSAAEEAEGRLPF